MPRHLLHYESPADEDERPPFKFPVVRTVAWGFVALFVAYTVWFFTHQTTT